MELLSSTAQPYRATLLNLASELFNDYTLADWIDQSNPKALVLDKAR